MTTVKQLLKDKGDTLYQLPPDASVYDALCLMSERDIGAVMIMESDMLEGIFTERDYARKVILHGKTSKEIPVHEIMTRQVIITGPHQSLAECMALMARHHIRHLPVVEGGHTIGLISMRDVVQRLLEDQESTIQRLESYMLGTDTGM